MAEKTTYTETKKKCNAAYMEKLSRVSIWCTPDEKEQLQNKAAAAGKSVNRFMLDAALGISEEKSGIKEKQKQ